MRTYSIELPSGKRIDLFAKATYARLTEGELNIIQKMKKDIGLANFSVDMDNIPSAWQIHLEEETHERIKSLLAANGYNEIPFVLADGRFRFGNLLILLDIDKDERIVGILNKLVTMIIARHLTFHRNYENEFRKTQEHIQTVKDAVLQSYGADGTWNIEVLSNAKINLNLDIQADGCHIKNNMALV